MRTKFKIGLWVMLGAIAAFIVFAAAPPPGTYIVPSFFTTNAAKIYGTNGVGVSSNATLGIYLIDGSGITGGDQVWTNQLGVIHPTVLSNRIAIGSATIPAAGFLADSLVFITNNTTNVQAPIRIDNSVNGSSFAGSVYVTSREGPSFSSTYSATIQGENKLPSIGTIEAAYENDGAFGGFFRVNNQTGSDGQGVGVYGQAKGTFFRNMGVVGAAFSPTLGLGTNIGVFGTARRGSVNVGGYFETPASLFPSDPLFPDSAALIADNRDTGNPIFIARSNQVAVFEVDANGDMTLIRQVPYLWPNANATGILTNDGVGKLGWFPDFLTSSATQSLRLSSFSNNVSLTSATTNYDFYNFLAMTQANGKVSIGTTFQNLSNNGYANFAGPVAIYSGIFSNLGTGIRNSGWQQNNNVLTQATAAYFTYFDTASEVLRSDPAGLVTQIPNGTGALTNDNTGNFGWFNGFTDTKGISLQTNRFGQTVGSSTNLVVLGAGGVVVKGTNTATGNGTNSLEIGLSRPLLDPFVVIDNVPFYPTNGWNHIVNEEWNGDATSTSVASSGTYPWSIAASGQTVSRVARLVEQDAYAYLSVITTNAGTASTYFLGSAVGSYLLATNVEIIWTARIRVGLTNTAAEVQKLIIGLGDNTANNEPGNGIYITVNTNVATNSFVACTGRASARTFNYTQHGSNTWTAFTWINVGARLDGTGTNAFFFCGHSLTNLTKFATNTDNIPNSVLCGPIFTTWRITDTTHALRLTNYCDNYHLWIRPLSVNN